jgi:hypothetical protein
MPRKRASQKTNSDPVFGQARRPAKMFRAGLYARVSTNDQQTLAMQNRAMRDHALGGHLKTGHRWPLQTSKPANGSDPEHPYLYIAGACRARIFWHGNGERLILTSPGRRNGNAGMRPELRPSGRNGGAARAAPVAMILKAISERKERPPRVGHFSGNAVCRA